MKKLAIGILAHVDSGKTTLAEALMFNSGNLRRAGRVDHGNAFLDTDAIERDRGITIFSKQAVLNLGSRRYTLLDTPGHVDFSAETERTLAVLDYAILVINGAEGVQSHTRTLWKMLEYYRVPTLVFVNKTDISHISRTELLADLKDNLCADFSDMSRLDTEYENIAVTYDAAMEEYLETEKITDGTLAKAILKRSFFPVWFGSALKNTGITEFIGGLEKYTIPPTDSGNFGARVFKVSDDESGKRLAHIKITGGKLCVRDSVDCKGQNKKVTEIRIYSGKSYESVQQAECGDVCAITGLDGLLSGDGLGCESDSPNLVSEALYTYSVILPDGTDISKALNVFRKLADEETKMNVRYNEYLQKITIDVMGEIQLEVLKRILSERFGLDVDFKYGSIVYKETIKNTVEGVGHFEPLKHYAEVHLRLEPNKRGSGILIASECSENALDRDKQRLVMTHLAEKEHIGVLTGSPITDIKITLINGRAHQKHTSGGDFRQAAYRAVRQGLMQAENVLLEPWCEFSLTVPQNCIGRAISDIDRMNAEYTPVQTTGNTAVLRGRAPMQKISRYQQEVIAYTRGEGTLSFMFCGYDECSESEKVISEIAYNCDADTENTADSVFCSHGGGYNVRWNEVFEHMHVPLESAVVKAESQSVKKYRKLIADEQELLRIFEQTYGKIKPKTSGETGKIRRKGSTSAKAVKTNTKIFDETYLLIDGYNIIFAWDDLKETAAESLDAARMLLINRMCNYRAMRDENIILVFDAYKVKGNHGEVENHSGISVVYTKEAETADSYIEKTSKILSKNYRVKVATSDNLEQLIIFGNGAFRISAAEFQNDVIQTEAEMRKMIENNV